MRTGDPSQVLIRVQGYAFEKILPSAYWMNVQSGKLRGAGSSPAEGGQFITGADDRISVVYGVNTNNETTVYYNPPDSSTVVDGRARNWIKQITTGGDAGDFYPVAWTGKGEEYYALDSRAAATLGVVVWDAAANTQRLLYRNPDFDMQPAGLDPAGRPWVFQGTDHYPFYWYPDPEHPLARMHRTLVQQFPRHFIDVVSETKDLSLAIVRLSAADRPPTFLVVDVRAVKPLQLMPTYPALKAVKMAAVDAIEYAARDGLKIRGYITTPRGADGKPARKLPTVVMIHGGPFGVVDTYRYNFERQLLASRGYAVLQINYRGSGGRGTAFERAGYGKWGREMQDDITDGVRWAIQDGVADAARLCIYGGSYGAYAALTGAFREPTMFRCAVGMSGVYDLPMMFDRGDVQMFSRGVNYLKEALGQDREDLRARSPVYNAKAIQAKVMLLHGVNDQRAPLPHAERMRKALIDAGNPPEWLVETGESHGFFSPAHRAEAYGQILQFIEKNIGRGE
jgi:dipeptidyl aminopeptidase/acylaminoacyl peptidase